MAKFIPGVDSAGEDLLVNPDLICYAFRSEGDTTVVVFAATEGQKDGSRKLMRKVLKIPLDQFRALVEGTTAG